MFIDYTLLSLRIPLLTSSAPSRFKTVPYKTKEIKSDIEIDELFTKKFINSYLFPLFHIKKDKNRYKKYAKYAKKEGKNKLITHGGINCSSWYKKENEDPNNEFKVIYTLN